MLSDFMSIGAATNIGSEAKILLAASYFFVFLSLSYFFKAYKALRNNSGTRGIYAGVLALMVAIACTQLVRLKALDSLSDSKVVVNKSLFTKEKYLELNDRTLDVAIFCLELGSKCSKANKDVIFSPVDSEVITTLDNKFSTSNKSEKLVSMLKKAAKENNLTPKNKLNQG